MAILKPKFVVSATPFQAKDLDAEAALRLEEAREQARRIVKAAQEEAARIRALAEADRQGALERGVAAGKAEGIEKGRAEGRLASLDSAQKALAPGAARVESLLGILGPALNDAILRASTDAEAGVIRLALAIAKSVVKREVKLDPGIVLGNVEAAVALAARRGGLEIRVHPDDLVLMEQFVPELAARFDGLVVASVVADETIGRGGAQVAWAEGSANAAIDGQLREIERLLL